MPHLHLALLGPCQLQLAGHLVPQFPTAKVQALLAYLAVEAQTVHARDTLIGLFWPDYTTESARQNLRQTLFRLRQLIPPELLLVTNQTVQFNAAGDYHLDVSTFTDLITVCHRHAHPNLSACAECSEWLEQAIELYRGDFLTGFFLDDCPAFEEWLLLKREWLRREALQALAQLADYHERQGAYGRAQVYAWRQVELDPPREEAHQQLMRVLALSGRRSEALAQYESCRRLLAEELGVEPSAETMALYEQIRAGELGKGPRSPPPAADQSVSSSPAPVSTPSAAAPATPPASEATIRLVTVLCVGASEAEEMHPEAAAQAGERLVRLSAPIVASYEARLEQGAGAGVVAIFGAEQTHEDDPERAVRATLAIREAAKAAGLVVSAGVSTGNILLAPSGAPAGANTFAGSAVTLAMRLQGQAAPGQLLIGESTYRQTHAAIHFTPLALALPGRSYTRTVYQAEHPLARPQKSRGLAPLRADLVGRNKELAELKQVLAAVQAGDGQMVVLIGEAGIGKSRLVTELKQSATADDNPNAQLRWLEGRCLELAMAASYWPFLDILHTYLSWQPENEEASRAEQIVNALDTLVAQGQLTQEQRDEMGPLLGNLLAVRFGNDWDERLKFAGPEQIRHQTLLALRDLFVALSRQRSLVLVLEDLHWADSLSLDLVTLLMEVLAQQPLLLLCVYRPEQQHRSWQLATLATAKCPDSLTEVRLRELTSRQSQQLVEALLTIENLAPRVKELILQQAQGNPLFVEEVIRSLIDAGIVYRQGEVWRAKEEIEQVVVPETVQSVILSRVDRLDEALKELLQRAAVIGRVFGRQLLAQLVPPGIDLDNAVLALTNQTFIYQERVVPEEEYSFKHVLVQEAIYQTTLRERREQFHRLVAEAMEQLYGDNLAERYEQLAYHYDRSGVVEKAIEYLLKAGGKARRAYLNDEAIGYFQRTLERVAEQPQELGETQKAWRLAALRGLGQIYYGIGKMAEAEVCFRQTIVLGHELRLAPHVLVRLYHWLGDIVWWQSRFDEKIRIGEEGLALLADDQQSVEAALMNTHIAWGYYFKGNLEKARAYTLVNALFIDNLFYIEDLSSAYINIIIIYAVLDKNMTEALMWAQALEDKAKQSYDLWALARVYEHIASVILSEIGNLRGALEYFQKSLELYTQIGSVTGAGSCHMGMSIGAYLPRGDLEQVEEHAQEALDILQKVGHIAYVASLNSLIGVISLCRDLPQNATIAFQKAKQLRQDISSPGESSPGEARSLICLGRTSLALANRAEARQQFQQALSLLKPRAYPYWQQPFVLALCGLEEAYDDDASFRTFCYRFQAERPDLEPGSPALFWSAKQIPNGFVQWFLEPTELAIRFLQADREWNGDKTHNLDAYIQTDEWTWRDQFEDCSFAMHNGLEIHAANGRDLFHVNLSAPRFLRSATGEFAIQAVCLPVSDEKPTQGGILLWYDPTNYLRLDRGTFGKHEITFLGCLDNNEVIIGRGRLPAERVYLRLERIGQQVNALCSADGEAWFTVGHVDFPAADPLQVGLHAIGMIDRLIYPGAYPDGTAIRFESFTVYRSQ